MILNLIVPEKLLSKKSHYHGPEWGTAIHPPDPHWLFSGSRDLLPLGAPVSFIDVGSVFAAYVVFLFYLSFLIRLPPPRSSS